MPTIDWNVKNAINRDVERQHLNKILADIRAAVQSLEQKSGSTSLTPSTATSIKDIVGQMVTSNSESGIAVTYNNIAKVLDFAVANFMLTLAGDVTGSVTLSPGNNAIMQVEIDPALIGIGEAPLDNQPYWRQSGGWEMVPPNISALTETATSGIMVLDTADPEEPVWTSRTIQGPMSVVVTNGSGVAGDPSLTLVNDEVNPGNLESYATNMAGTKGWYKPALFESTGILMGGTMSINAGDNTKFDVTSTIVGQTDYTINAASPTRTALSVGPFTAQSTPSLAVTATYVGIQMPAGTLVYQNSPYTAAQTRTIAPLGAVISNGVNLIAVNNLPNVIRAGINQIGDLMQALGPMNISGNRITANGVNLQVNKSAGTVFKQGSNFSNDPFNPHGLSLASLTAANFNYRLSNGTQFATTNVVDPNNYESPLGTLGLVPAANRFTIQRFSVFTSNLIRAQYGQVVYNTMAEAEASLATEAFVTEQNISENGILLCFLIVQDGATDLSDVSQAKFIPASKFGGPVGTGGTSITNTDALPEGSTNLYFTDPRAIAAGSGVYQPLDATLTALAGANWSANSLPIGSGTDTVAQVTFAANTFPARASSGNLVAKSITDEALLLLGDATVPRLGTQNSWTSNQTFGGALISNTTNLFIRTQTADGADNGSILVDSGAGTQSAARGAFFRVNGNEAASNPGSVVCVSGNGADIIFSGGTLRPNADNTYGFGTASFRWGQVYVVNTVRSGSSVESGVSSPTQLTANTDNWSIANLANLSIIRASTDASRNLTGIASPTSNQVITLLNVGSNNLVLVHDATSTAANRFLCPNSTNLTLTPNSGARLWYDNVSSRWRVVAIDGSGGGGAVSSVNGLTGAVDTFGTGTDVDATGFRGIPQNSQSANYTCVAADAGKEIFHANGAGAGDTFTIPANASVAYEIGTAITFTNMDPSPLSIAITTDTLTLAGTGATGTRTLAQYGTATAVKKTSTLWLISGVGLS